MRTRKIVVIVLVCITLLATVGLFSNKAGAATYIIDKADFYAKGELICFTYQGIRVGVEFVVYEKNGVEYPAYCLNRNLPGVTEEEEYSVDVNGVVNNNAVWRAVINGYPFKTPEQLGCNSEIEAFAATKMAVYDALYEYNWDDFKGLDAQGNRVVAAAEEIAKKARSMKDTKLISVVNVMTRDKKWEMDENQPEYASKTFEVTTNTVSTKFKVALNNVEINGAKVTDLENNEKTEFKIGESFKVLLPINEMDKAGEFEIEVTADMKTKPILYGESGDSNKQSYALAAGEYEYETGKMNVKYLPNTTTIELIKKDAETGEPLKGAKFNLMDENYKKVYSDITTNDAGVATVENIQPGKYYIQEYTSPDGYTTYGDWIEVDVALNQKYTITVNNYKKPEPEEKEVPDEDLTVTGDKEENLPQTGF